MKSLILIIIFLGGCDTFFSEPITLNEKENLEIKTLCGVLSMSAEKIEPSFKDKVITITQSYDKSSLIINPDSLLLKTSHYMLKIKNIIFYDENGNKINKIERRENTVMIKKVVINTYLVDTLIKGNQYIYLLPSNYMICKEKKLIRDTIKIKLN